MGDDEAYNNFMMSPSPAKELEDKILSPPQRTEMNQQFKLKKQKVLTKLQVMSIKKLAAGK